LVWRADSRSAGEREEMGERGGRAAALEMRMWIGPNWAVAVEKAEVISDCEEMSTVRGRTVQCGKRDSMLDLVVRRVECVRPKRTILEAPDSAKARAMNGPRPLPPPVMRTVLLEVEREGLRGEMEE
jgi:hypothetical protein